MKIEEFKKILKENKLTLKKFSQLTNVKYDTCVRWGKNDRPVSDWVESWLKLYIENNELKKYKESVQTVMSGLNTDK